MASQGQVVAGQHNRWLEPFVIALAIATIMITLAWGALTALSAPSTVAPSATSTQVFQEPGLLEQRRGERGGSVVVPSTESTIMTDGLVEQRRGERGVGQSLQKTGTNGFNGFGNTGYGREQSSILSPRMVEHGEREFD
jgi:hypothetical protein